MAKNPLYIDTAAKIAAYIRDKNLFPGSKLPGGRKLAEILGVSKNTVFEAIDYLKNEGLIDVQHASGSYVTESLWRRDEQQWERFTNYKYNKPASNILQKVAREGSEYKLSQEIVDRSFGYEEMLAKAMDDVKQALFESDELTEWNVYGANAACEAVRTHLRGKGIDAEVNQIVLSPSSESAIDTVIKALTSGHSVIEIEYYDDLTPGIKSLKSLDKDVIYINTLIPCAQVGSGGAWIVAPDYVIPKILDVSINTRLVPPTLNYMLIERLLSKGYYRDFLREFALKVEKRIAFTNKILQKHLSEYASWDENPGYGVYWIKMKPQVNLKAMFENKKGISFMLGSFLDPEDKSHLCLCSCRLPEEDLEKAVIMLKELAAANLYKLS